MPQWQSPIELALRSGSRASGAMQKELDDIASSGSVFRTIDPSDVDLSSGPRFHGCVRGFDSRLGRKYPGGDRASRSVPRRTGS